MATRKKKKNETTAYVKAVLIFICAVGVSLVIFLLGVQSSIEKRSQKTIVTNVSRQSEHVKSILDIHYGYLNGIAKEIGKSDNLLSDANMEMLDALAEKTALERTALVEPDGTAHYDNGVTKNVSARRYFKEAIRGKETLSDPLESSVDQETRVVLGVPVWKDEEVIGILCGSYNVTSLSRMLFNDFFEDVGYTLITTGYGEIIAYDGDSTYHKITYGDDFFGFYNNQTMLGGSSLGKVKKDFTTGTDGLMIMRNGNDRSSDRYLAYTSMGLNDWMICYVIPVSKAQKSYDFIRWYELIFTVGFVIMVCLLILYIFHKTKARNMQLLRAAETDAVFVLLHLAQKALVLARAGGEQLPLRQAAPVAVEREKLRVARKGALRSLEVDVPLAAAQAARHGVEFPVLAGKVLTRLHAAGDRVTVRVKIRNFVHNSPQNASSRYSMRVAAALCAVSV